MTFETVLQSIITINPFFIVKLGFIIGMVLYAVFAYVMVRQEQLMSQIVFLPTTVHIRTLVILHLIATILILLLAILVL